MAATRDDDTKENMPILYPIALPKNEKPKAQGKHKQASTARSLTLRACVRASDRPREAPR